MQEFVIESFKEDLVEAVQQHTIAVISGNKRQQQETLAKLEEAYTHFRYISPPMEKEKHRNGY